MTTLLNWSLGSAMGAVLLASSFMLLIMTAWLSRRHAPTPASAALPLSSA